MQYVEYNILICMENENENDYDDKDDIRMCLKQVKAVRYV